MKVNTELFDEPFNKIEELIQNNKLIMAIDGSSAAGKSTLAAVLAERYGAVVFHADDFFLRPEQRTAERLNEAGGNMDRERLKAEVLESLSKGERVTYRAFDCRTMSLKEPVSVEPGRLNIIEGAYSMHPELESYYGFSVFLDIDPETQRQRILKRNDSAKAEMFFSRWIPMEKRYIEELKVKERCQMLINIKD